MPAINKYNIYSKDGRIIKANINRKEIAALVGLSESYVAEILVNMVSGQKKKIKDYTVEYALDPSMSAPNTEAKKLLNAEWDKTCKPFRALRRKTGCR